MAITSPSLIVVSSIILFFQINSYNTTPHFWRNVLRAELNGQSAIRATMLTAEEPKMQYKSPS